MSNKNYISITAFESGDIEPAYSEADWNAVLSGDIDTALRAKPQLTNAKTGKPLSAAQAQRLIADRVKAVEPPKPTMSSVTAAFWQRYREQHGIQP